MKTFLFVITFFSAAPSVCTAQEVALLPAPQVVTWQKGTFRLDRPYRLHDETNGAAKNVYTESIMARACVDATTRRVVVFTSAKPLSQDEAAKGHEEEAYQLRITPDTVFVSATAKLGFIRAGQTLTQLLYNKPTALPAVSIADAPQFEWRGVMLDVSRHFFPLAFLEKQVETLAAYKINRLHLHLTDAAGWRMEIARYPRLTQLGAWRTEAAWKPWWNGSRQYALEGTPEAHGGYYTQAQLRHLVAFAAARGIDIVPEIEMPAHSEEVLTAYPELSCTHEPYKQADFCMGNPSTMTFLENVLTEVMRVFPSKVIHVGGDEAGKQSWKTCPRCQQKAKELGLKNTDALQGVLISHIGEFLKKNGRELLAWDEVIVDTAARGANVMVWRSQKFAKQALQQGYRVVMAPGTHCYLDFYQDAPPTQPEAIGGYTPLAKVRRFAPLEGLTAEEQRGVRGVQCNLWTEYIGTPAQAEYMLYPRALALAEVGWGSRAEGFRQRALQHTAHLRAAGTNAFPLAQERGERPERTDRPLKHKAVGATVAYLAPYHEAYPAAGPSSLTDGLRGGWANNDGRWQGFIGRKRLDVMLDLGKPTTISTVAADFMQQQGPEIYLPSAFRVSVSADGEQWQEVCAEKHTFDAALLHDVRTFAWKGRAVKARYVRVEAPASEKGGWVFTDEIIIN